MPVKALPPTEMNARVEDRRHFVYKTESEEMPSILRPAVV